jgi:phosphatidylglycerol---prolipoprotein diacylglyceryl transferase
MIFPIDVPFFGLALPAHTIFETLSYFVGYQTYRVLRRMKGDFITEDDRLFVFAGAIVGAALGSKLLGLLEHPQLWTVGSNQPLAWFAAKTILGGLLGGILGVEIIKKARGQTRSTGDIYVIPIIIGMMIGRIGCAMTGVEDGTWGIKTDLIIGFDAGDGIIRHPTPIYEILFLGLCLIIWTITKPAHHLREGQSFKLFIMTYCAWRFFVEFLKPVSTYWLTQAGNFVANHASSSDLTRGEGLSVLQAAAALGLVWQAWYFFKIQTRGKPDGGT